MPARGLVGQECLARRAPKDREEVCLLRSSKGFVVKDALVSVTRRFDGLYAMVSVPVGDGYCRTEERPLPIVREELCPPRELLLGLWQRLQARDGARALAAAQAMARRTAISVL